MNSKPECFVIAPIGAPRSKARKRTETLLKFVIEPIASEGYTVTIAHRLEQPGRITVQVIEKIVSSDLLIADLTDSNANVFYELSLRHVLNAPAILLVQENQLKSVPFDLRDMRTTPYDLTDLHKIEDTKTALTAQIKAIGDSDAVARMSNVISDEISVIPEPQGPDIEVTLLGTILIANRIRYELIGQYSRKLGRDFERRLDILQSVFGSIMRESARKDYLSPDRIKSAFPNPEYKKTIENLFSDVENIITSLSEGIHKRNEKKIDKALEEWRRNTLAYRLIWTNQYRELLESEEKSFDM